MLQLLKNIIYLLQSLVDLWEQIEGIQEEQVIQEVIEENSFPLMPGEYNQFTLES